MHILAMHINLPLYGIKYAFNVPKTGRPFILSRFIKLYLIII